MSAQSASTLKSLQKCSVLVQKLSAEQQTLHTLNKSQIGDVAEVERQLMLVSAT